MSEESDEQRRLDEAFAKLDGDRTEVECATCEQRFPFRECRLFIEEDEYIFLCEACHDEHVMQPFRKIARDAGFVDFAWNTLRQLSQSEDPEVRAQAEAALVRYQVLGRLRAPPSPESN